MAHGPATSLQMLFTVVTRFDGEELRQKNRMLERRRVQLLQAIRSGSDHDVLEKRVSELLRAVLSVIKKHHTRYYPFRDFDKNAEWKAVVDRWTTMTINDIIEIVSTWREGPSYTQILHACDDKLASAQNPEHDVE